MRRQGSSLRGRRGERCPELAASPSSFWKAGEATCAAFAGYGASPGTPKTVQALSRQLTAASSAMLSLHGRMGETEPAVAEALRAIEKARRSIMELALDTGRAGE